MPRVRLADREVPVPRSRLARIGLGIACVLLGFVGFLPVIGFWMVPLGLAILSIDIPVVRRLRRRLEVWVLRRWAIFKAERRRVDRIQSADRGR